MTVNNLQENLNRQIEMYQQLLAIVRQQLIAIGESGAMESWLAQRQNLMNQIESIQSEARSIESELAEEFGLPNFNLRGLDGNLSGEQYNPLAKSYARLGWVLSEIVAVDIEFEEAMRNKIAALTTSAPKPAPSGQQAIDAYKAQNQKKTKS